MWYVVQTLGGQEEQAANMIKRLVSPDFLEECFIPKGERLKKFHGRWNRVEEVLFHGYAFVVSKRPEELYEELKRVPKLTKVLGREADYFLALGENEEKMVRELGDIRHKTCLSKVMVGDGKKIHVIDGPLKGYLGNIVRVNLHKREVVVKVEFMGREVELKMGVEMVDTGERG